MKCFEVKLGMEVMCYGYLEKLKKQYVFPSIKPELYTEEQLEVIRHTKNKDSIFLGVDRTVQQKQYDMISTNKVFDGIVVGIKQVALYKGYTCKHDEKENKYYIDSYVSGSEDNLVLCAVVCCDLSWDGSHKERLVPFGRMYKKVKKNGKSN